MKNGKKNTNVFEFDLLSIDMNVFEMNVFANRCQKGFYDNNQRVDEISESTKSPNQQNFKPTESPNQQNLRTESPSII